MSRPLPTPPPGESTRHQKRLSLIGRPLSQISYSSPVPVKDSTAPYAVSPSIGSSGARTIGDADLRATNHDPVDHRIKLVCVGDGGCGKTCMLATYASGKFPTTYVPTVFENYLSNVRASSGKLIELALWDTAGQEEYDRLRALSYPEVDVLLVCFSIDSPTTLDNVYDKWLPEVSHHCPGIPFILVGLKTDLRNDLTTVQHLQSRGQQPISYEQASAIAKRYGAARYFECSARLNQGVSEIFNVAIALALKETPPILPLPIRQNPKRESQLEDSRRRKVPSPLASQSGTTSNHQLRKTRKKACIIL